MTVATLEKISPEKEAYLGDMGREIITTISEASPSASETLSACPAVGEVVTSIATGVFSSSETGVSFAIPLSFEEREARLKNVKSAITIGDQSALATEVGRWYEQDEGQTPEVVQMGKYKTPASKADSEYTPYAAFRNTVTQILSADLTL